MLFMDHFFKLIMTVEVSNCCDTQTTVCLGVIPKWQMGIFIRIARTLFVIVQIFLYEGFTVANLHVRIFTMSDQLHVSFAFTHGEWGPIRVGELHILWTWQWHPYTMHYTIHSQFFKRALGCHQWSPLHNLIRWVISQTGSSIKARI
jgi:hypothetical protein